jgi:hypothetical protein
MASFLIIFWQRKLLFFLVLTFCFELTIATHSQEILEAEYAHFGASTKSARANSNHIFQRNSFVRKAMGFFRPAQRNVDISSHSSGGHAFIPRRY